LRHTHANAPAPWGQASRAELSSARPIQPSLPKRWFSQSPTNGLGLAEDTTNPIAFAKQNVIFQIFVYQTL